MSRFLFFWMMILVVLAVLHHCDAESLYAKVNLTSQNGTKWGVLKFSQKDENSKVRIQGKLNLGFTAGKHGFHVHTVKYAGEGDGCKNTGKHYNPNNKDHGPPNSTSDRHVGDLGNIVFNAKGVADVNLQDGVITLYGTSAKNAANSISARSVVIHGEEDDLGGGGGDSKKTGNAGPRLTCGNIELTSENDPAFKGIGSKACVIHNLRILKPILVFGCLILLS